MDSSHRLLMSCFLAQVPISKLFSYADTKDKVHMVIGTIAAAFHAW